MDHLTPGTILDGRYEILALIGEGTTGVVYKARQQLMNRVVAVKMLHSRLAQNPHMLKRFQQEAKAASSLSHPNIVNVYDFSALPTGEGYLVMDFLEGTSLTEFVKASGKVPVSDAIDILRQCCAALAYAHKNGVVHRDVKPANIFLAQATDASRTVKLVDFGIAKIFDEDGGESQRLTQTGEIFGSPVYMSPEQALGRNVDNRSDIYSLGCVIYECLSGRPPFSGNSTAETVSKHLTQKPEPLATYCSDVAVPQWLEELVFKALAKDVSARPQSVSEIQDVLKQRAGDGSLPSPAVGAVKRAGPGWPRTALILSLSVVLAAGCLAFWLTLTSGGAVVVARTQLDLERFWLSPEDPKLLVPMSNLFRAYLRDKRTADAVTVGSKMLELLEKQNGYFAGKELDDLISFCESDQSSEARSPLAAQLSEKLFYRLIRQGQNLQVKGEMAQAALVWRHAAAVLRKFNGADDAAVLSAMRSEAHCLWQNQDRKQSIAVLEKVVSGIRSSTKVAKTPDLMRTFVDLGVFYRDERRFPDADRLFKLALELSPQNDALYRSSVLRDYANLKLQSGDSKAALKLAEQAVEAAEQATTSRYVILCDTLLTAAQITEGCGDYAKSIKYEKRVSSLSEKQRDHFHAVSAIHLAHLYEMSGQTALVEQANKYAVASCIATGSQQDREDMVKALHQQAGYFARHGRCKEAEPIYRQALALQQTLQGDWTWEVATLYRELANCCCDLDKFEEAEQLYSKALSLLEGSKLDFKHEIASTLNSQADFFIKARRYTDARIAVDSASKLCDPSDPSWRSELEFNLMLYSRMLNATGKHEEAESYLARAKSYQKK